MQRRSLQFSSDEGNFEPAPDISLVGMAVSSVPIVLVALVSLYLKLGNVTTLLLAAVRCVCQLLLLGLILYPIFVHNRPYIVLPYLFAMIVFATREASVKPKHRYVGMRLQMLLTITLGVSISFTVITTLVLRPTPWWDASVMIPVCGMMMGSCVNALSLGIDRFVLSLSGSGRGSARLQTYVAAGATRWEASLPSIREAIETGMTPNLNQMSIMGLVSIPGMMAGQILGGTPPFLAAKYQIVIMFFICSNSTMVLCGVIAQAVFFALFDKQHRFRCQIVSKRGGGKPKDIVQAAFSGAIRILTLVQKSIGLAQRKREDSLEVEDGVIGGEAVPSSRKRGTFQLKFGENLHTANDPSLLLSFSDGKINIGEQLELTQLNMALREEDVIVLTGPSGCGKSTYLRSLAMMDPLLDQQGGSLRLHGRAYDVIGAAAWRTEVCYARQQGAQGLRGTPRDLLINLCLLRSQRLRMGGKGDQSSKAAMAETELRLTKNTEDLGLSKELLDRSWDQLSGGESQRIYLCVLLALRPSVLLLDEPTSACDKSSALRVEGLLLDSEKVALVWVSHDASQIERLQNSSKAIMMEYRDLSLEMQ